MTDPVLGPDGKPLETPPQPPPQPPSPVVLQGEHIPEAFRGKTDKEVVEMLLNTSAELERTRGQISERDQQIEQLKPKPPLEQLSEAEKRVLKEKELINDPTGWVEKHVEQRLAPLTQEYFKGQSEVQLNLAKGDKENYPSFHVLEKDIRSILEKMPLEARANPMSIKFAYDMAEVPVLRKMIKEGRVRDGLHSEGGGSPPPEPPKKVVLDDEEKAVAKRFGMTEDEYVKYSGKGTIDEF